MSKLLIYILYIHTYIHTSKIAYLTIYKQMMSESNIFIES